MKHINFTDLPNRNLIDLHQFLEAEPVKLPSTSKKSQPSKQPGSKAHVRSQSKEGKPHLAAPKPQTK